MEIALVPSADGILLIGDNRFLLRLVATNLAPLTMTAVHLEPGSTPIPSEHDTCQDRHSYKLVLLALSRSSNEPVVVLTRAGLTRLVGSIPLLIISDRAFEADPARQIFHLSFPFSAEELRQQVNNLLPQNVDRVSG